MKEKSNLAIKIIILIFAILLVIILAIVVAIKVFKVDINSIDVEVEAYEAEQENNLLPYVYNADYTYEDLKGKSYIAPYEPPRTFLFNDDIILPYININSDDAKKANEEIKNIFNNAAESFKESMQEVKKNNFPSGVEVRYDQYINNKVLSILITESIYTLDVPFIRYYTYNFDLDSGKKIGYNEIIKRLSLTDTISEKVKNLIFDYESFKDFKDKNTLDEDEEGAYIPDEYESKEAYIQLSVDAYEKTVKEDTVKYFINDKGKLNIIPILQIPAGREFFEIIIEVE